MSVEPRRVPGESSGFLKGCLVDGDAEQRTRERRVRRRALVISVALQSAVLATLILVPLFGKPARITLASVIPLPPYGARHEARPVADRTESHNSRHRQNVCRFCLSPTIPLHIVMHDPIPEGQDGDDSPLISDGLPTGEIPLIDSRNGPKGPPDKQNRVEKPTIVHRTRLDPAMLVHRVEPVYPTFPRQLGRGGRVELRAIIATDGTIQSLQVVGGDPLFYQSALEAVRQWRYTPTVLNGLPVEIDTYISVIYTMQR
jgi:TonB family protein